MQLPAAIIVGVILAVSSDAGREQQASPPTVSSPTVTHTWLIADGGQLALKHVPDDGSAPAECTRAASKRCFQVVTFDQGKTLTKEALGRVSVTPAPGTKETGIVDALRNRVRVLQADIAQLKSEIRRLGGNR